jgi:hypothetical protein
MRIRDNLLVFLVGGIAATALHLSCDGDGAAPADAAAQCDCPAAEAPLVGRLTRASATIESASMMVNGQVALCPIGDIVISGGCKGGSNDSRYLLKTSYPEPADAPVGWYCQFYNGTASPVTSEAHVLCLKPAP